MHVHDNTDANVQERFQTFGDLAAINAAGVVYHFTAAYIQSLMHADFDCQVLHPPKEGDYRVMSQHFLLTPVQVRCHPKPIMHP